MPKTRNNDVEVLATWLCGASLQKPDGFDTLRQIVRQAAVDAAEMYADEGELKGDEDEPADPLGVRDIVARFATALDEDKRLRDEEEE